MYNTTVNNTSVQKSAMFDEHRITLNKFECDEQNKPVRILFWRKPNNTTTIPPTINPVTKNTPKLLKSWPIWSSSVAKTKQNKKRTITTIHISFVLQHEDLDTYP